MSDKMTEKEWQDLFGKFNMKDMILASAYLNEAMAYRCAGKENDQDTTNLKFLAEAKFWREKLGKLSMIELIVVSSYLSEAMARYEANRTGDMITRPIIIGQHR